MSEDTESIVGLGHNHPPPDPPNPDATRVLAIERLRSIVGRIERLNEERAGLANDVKEIFQEAKSAGFNPKVLRQLIAIRKREPAEVEEDETLLDVYRHALGM
jgi:uncharacterized protein (UPF0335 family)